MACSGSGGSRGSSGTSGYSNRTHGCMPHAARPAPAAASVPLTSSELRVYVKPLQLSGFMLGSFLRTGCSQLGTQDPAAAPGPALIALLDTVAALLASDALAATSRLLAAEEQRGKGALVEPLNLQGALMPTTQLCCIVAVAPRHLTLPPTYQHQHQQRHHHQEQEMKEGRQEAGAEEAPPREQPLVCAVLQALARSSYLDRVCRLALRYRMTPAAHRGDMFVMRYCYDVTCAAQDVMRTATYAEVVARETRDAVWAAAAGDALAACLAPGVQHFEASHVVSELHAMDGGTLYGMPHGPLAPTQQLVPGIVNTDRVNGVLNAFKIWAQAAELRPPTAQLPLPPLGPRSQVALCMRMARVFVDMLETRGSAAGGSGAAAAATTAVAAASGRRQVRSGQAGRGASVDGGGGSGAAAAVVLLVPPAECLSACLTALNSAVIIMACHTWQGGGKGGGGAVGDAGESPGQGAMAGSLEWICGKPTAGEVDWLFHRLAIRATWLRRGAFAREWWPLVVPAVHAQLDSVPAGGLGADRDPTTSRVLALLMLPSMGEPPAILPPRPPPRLAAALSAGYIPCIEHLLRSCLAGGGTCTRFERVAELQHIKIALPWKSLPELLAYGEERQAAALLITLVKAAAEELAVHVADNAQQNGATERLALSLLHAVLAVVMQAGRGARAAADGATGGGGGRSSSDSGGGGSGGGGGDGSASPQDANRQLARLLSFVMLPVLSLCTLVCNTVGDVPLVQQLQPPRVQQEHVPDADASLTDGSTIPGVKVLTGKLLKLALLAWGKAAARDDLRAANSWQLLVENPINAHTTSVGVGSPSEEDVALSALLLPPCDVGEVLPVCSNPRCMAFEGASEAGRGLKRCGGRCGGGMAYCCAACQEAHWGAGHREECEGQR